MLPPGALQSLSSRRDMCLFALLIYAMSPVTSFLTSSFFGNYMPHVNSSI